MDNTDLKKLLAGMSLVALLGGAGLAVTGCATTGGSAATKPGETTADSELTEPASDNLTG